MSTPQSNIVSDEYRAELAAKGQALYETKLKSLLEPTHNGEYIAIHVDTGDYALGPSWIDAKRILRQRHPRDGRVIGRKIGSEPEYGLAARLLAADMAAGQVK